MVIRPSRVLVLLVFLVAACGGEPVASPGTTTTTSPPAPTTTSTSTSTSFPVEVEVESVPDDRPIFQGLSAMTVPEGTTLVAMASGEVEVYESPGDTTPIHVLPAETILGTVTVLSIVQGPIDGWAEVLLPVRPNDATGWIDTSEMSMFVVEGRVVINLSERSLIYFENEEVVLETAIAIGTNRNPTPTGSFFVTDTVTLADPNSPWGPHAFGLSARSDTITEYNGGDGIIGIHGTNRPSSVGQAASLGCIRLPNDVITQLHERIPIGTPVEIVA